MVVFLTVKVLVCVTFIKHLLDSAVEWVSAHYNVDLKGKAAFKDNEYP